MSTEAKSNKSPTESVKAEVDEKLPLDSNGADTKDDKPERVKFDMNACLIERGISGKVMWYNPFKAFGFLSRDDKQPDVFVHSSDIVRISRHARVLTEGEDVEFDVVRGHRGPEARAVTGKGGKVIQAYAYRVGETIRIHRAFGPYRKRRNEANGISGKVKDETDKVSGGGEKTEGSTGSSGTSDGSTESTSSGSTEDAEVEKEDGSVDVKQQPQNGKDTKPEGPAKANGKQSPPQKPQDPAKENGKQSSPQKPQDSKKEAQKTAQEPNTEKKKIAQEPKVEVQKVAQDQKPEKPKVAQEPKAKQQQPPKQNTNPEKPKNAQKKPAQKTTGGKK